MVRRAIRKTGLAPAAIGVTLVVLGVGVHARTWQAYSDWVAYPGQPHSRLRANVHMVDRDSGKSCGFRWWTKYAPDVQVPTHCGGPQVGIDPVVRVPGVILSRHSVSPRDPRHSIRLTGIGAARSSSERWISMIGAHRVWLAAALSPTEGATLGVHAAWMWGPGLVLAAPFAVARCFRIRRKRAGLCDCCGYDLRDLSAGAACPECGRGAVGG